jgi:hypothetical protein
MKAIQGRPTRFLARDIPPPFPLSHLGTYPLFTQALSKVVHDYTGPDERDGEDQHGKTGKGRERLQKSSETVSPP